MTNLEGIRSDNYKDYMTHLIKIRNEVFAGKKIELSEPDFTWAIRIYFHWHVDLGTGAFMDFRNSCIDCLEVLDKYADGLGNYAAGIRQLLSQYLQIKAFDPSRFSYIDSSVEIAAFADLQVISSKLERLKASKEELSVIKELTGMMRSMASCLGVCETLLGKIAAQQIDCLYALFITLAPVYQGTVLSAFSYNDDYKGNEKIIDFHQKYLDSNPEFWTELAAENLEALKAV